MDSPKSKADILPSLPSSPQKLEELPELPRASLKRPAPSLLPAFELSPSSGFSRSSAKRFRRHSPSREDAFAKYPTPFPTSTTGILSSSPPRLGAVSERAPLKDLRSIILPANGEEILMGRSGSSSHFQLSANRLISRVHVRARYIPSTILHPSKMEIRCEGCNGIKLHCQAQTYELGKGDSFTSETDTADVMLDVQDARVMIHWPSKDGLATDDEWNSSDAEQESTSAAVGGEHMSPSPMRVGPPLGSPVSPTPVGTKALVSRPSSGAALKIYEDEAEAENERKSNIDVQDSLMTQIASQPLELDAAEFSRSDLSEPENDPDEENDPVIHSFGPFGANLSSFTTVGSPSGTESPYTKQGRSNTSQVRTRSHTARKAPASPAPRPRSRSRSTPSADPNPIVNHAINQLAFSRVASTPLSTILSKLPGELKSHQGHDNESSQENKGLTKEDLRAMLEGTKCIGEVKREGKDAAGKPLESEFYYIPEDDRDEERKRAVIGGLGRVGLRECRKSHKQYYWRKPKTP